MFIPKTLPIKYIKDKFIFSSVTRAKTLQYLEIKAFLKEKTTKKEDNNY